MKKALLILQRKLDGSLTNRETAEACLVSPSTVTDVMARWEASGLTWPLPADVDEAALERQLYDGDRTASTIKEEDKPDLKWVHEELRKKGVTLHLLWQEYRQAHPQGYHYSYFCEQYAAHFKQLEPVMRQTHAYGHKCFVDYAGDTVPVVDPETGEVREAQIFVGVLGASTYTYAEATWSQEQANWLASHVRMLNYFQGSPRVLVPDNLRSGVSKADRYEPEIHPAYQALAEHYGAVVIPARVKRPKDKAKVENGVLIVERWILAALRNRRFFSLTELNEAIGSLLVELNARPFQKMDGCRQDRFDTRERPVLKPLPTEPYVLRHCTPVRVPQDYHVVADGHWYSVPFTLIGEVVEVWTAPSTIEVCHRNRRVALHQRSFERDGRTVVESHMPPAHREVSQWTPERLVAWAGKIGLDTVRVIEAVIAARPHPEMAVNSCLGVLRMSKKYSPDELEAACRRAVAIKAPTYKSVKSILSTGQHRLPLPRHQKPKPIPLHENVRGSGYYQAMFEGDEASC